MKCIAIIPARSGSKGLKDKNIKELNGKPLLGYSVEAALDSKLFDTVMVSTDSERYAEVARQCGAEVPFLRSEFTSSDSASSWDAVKEVIANYKKMGRDFDVLVLLQPTSPLRSANDIAEAFKVFKEKNAKAVISVCEVDHSPLWCNTLESDYSMINFAKTSRPNGNRQMLDTYYRLNGAIYMLRTSVLNNIDRLYADECYAYIMSRKSSVDIDNLDDFKYAEFLMQEK